MTEPKQILPTAGESRTFSLKIAWDNLKLQYKIIVIVIGLILLFCLGLFSYILTKNIWASLCSSLAPVLTFFGFSKGQKSEAKKREEILKEAVDEAEKRVQLLLNNKINEEARKAVAKAKEEADKVEAQEKDKQATEDAEIEKFVHNNTPEETKKRILSLVGNPGEEKRGKE